LHARFGQENLQTDEEFVAKEIGHDTTRYDVDHTPRQALDRNPDAHAFAPPQHQQSSPTADSLSM